MKLWEAILEGAKQGPQLFGRLQRKDGGSCAIGAAMLAHGIRGQIAELSGLERLYPELFSECECPVEGCSIAAHHRPPFISRNLWNIIVDLNNIHRWSRQRIAEWLANRELKFKEIKQTQELATR